VLRVCDRDFANVGTLTRHVETSVISYIDGSRCRISSNAVRVRQHREPAAPQPFEGAPFGGLHGRGGTATPDDPFGETATPDDPIPDEHSPLGIFQPPCPLRSHRRHGRRGKVPNQHKVISLPPCPIRSSAVMAEAARCRVSTQLSFSHLAPSGAASSRQKGKVPWQHKVISLPPCPLRRQRRHESAQSDLSATLCRSYYDVSESESRGAIRAEQSSTEQNRSERAEATTLLRFCCAADRRGDGLGKRGCAAADKRLVHCGLDGGPERRVKYSASASSSTRHTAGVGAGWGGG
jgi:hypothetical protein